MFNKKSKYERTALRVAIEGNKIEGSLAPEVATATEETRQICEMELLHKYIYKLILRPVQH